jgi:hypothetical protein
VRSCARSTSPRCGTASLRRPDLLQREGGQRGSSDSIALALRTGATIFASDEILDEAYVAIPDEQEDEVEKFREFSTRSPPEDFGC